MSYRIEQNDNDIFFILIYMKTSFLFTIERQKCYIFSEKIKITKNVPVHVIFTGKNQ